MLPLRAMVITTLCRFSDTPAHGRCRCDHGRPWHNGRDRIRPCVPWPQQSLNDVADVFFTGSRFNKSDAHQDRSVLCYLFCRTRADRYLSRFAQNSRLLNVPADSHKNFTAIDRQSAYQ